LEKVLFLNSKNKKESMLKKLKIIPLHYWRLASGANLGFLVNINSLFGIQSRLLIIALSNIIEI